MIENNEQQIVKGMSEDRKLAENYILRRPLNEVDRIPEIETIDQTASGERHRAA